MNDEDQAATRLAAAMSIRSTTRKSGGNRNVEPGTSTASKGKEVSKRSGPKTTAVASKKSKSPGTAKSESATVAKKKATASARKTKRSKADSHTNANKTAESANSSASATKSRGRRRNITDGGEPKKTHKTAANAKPTVMILPPKPWPKA